MWIWTFFKQINDTYGHLFGDHVLRETANIFKDVLPSDTIISRFGGDEFILFFPNISRIDLIQKLNLLMQHIHNVEMLNDTDNLTCSMGICFVPENTASYTYDQLMENADWALYQAKDNRRDTYIFCDDMNRYQELRNADSSNKNKIDARYFQNYPIATAFEVMETCLSVEEGISMLLKIIGMRFHLDRISIIDMN
ncbi:GGDEF domain-containing protein [Phascolarctobacterium sp.]|uniref:GGDEF domain-containing protein n=1 Tax=Phascolarctobacterium sp. TaxID=2049039 RepID=UPI002A82E9CE|nr:GGDEF domain-containing protein [Phascolarctobacterium sp.]MDY5044899.1 GGDEF domain-containing protein [Phascolarctobacterium sp.]